MNSVTSARDLSQLSPPPRKVYRRRGCPVPLRCLAFFVNPLVWLAVILLWRAVNNCGLAIFGQPGSVKVTHSEQVRNGKKDQCRIRYLYNDPEGGHIDFDSFPASYYDRYPPGSTIPMRSLRMFGHTSIMFEPNLSVGYIVGGAIFAVACNGIAIGAFFNLCLATLTQRRLLREGEAVVGRVTEKTIPKKKSPIYALAYTFTNSAGKARSNTMLVRCDDHELAKINDEVLVFYDPRKFRRSVVYEYSQYALREWASAKTKSVFSVDNRMPIENDDVRRRRIR